MTTRGEVTIPLMAVLTGTTALIIGFGGFLLTQTGNLGKEIASVKTVDASQGERITAVETKVERIEYLEAKVDKLLELRGVNPDLIIPEAKSPNMSPLISIPE